VRVHLVGLGAVGAGYGSRLLSEGIDLRVVADPDRAARYRHEATVVNDVEYRFPVLDVDDSTPADVALIAVKYRALREAIDLLRPRIDENSVIISLLNGVDSEQIIAQAFPRATVLLAVTVGIDAVRAERQVRYTSLGRILFGKARNDGEPSPAVAKVAALLEAAQIAHETPADMVHQLWWKFLINTGVNQVSAVLGAPYRAFQTIGAPAREAMIAAQREVIAVANAEGITLSEADLGAWLAVLARLGPDNYTSMAQDALEGRETEVEIFGGRVCELGRVHSIQTPVNELLVHLLSAGTALPPRTFGSKVTALRWS
jgi:2-dehydropantoate 2-reductase